MKINCKVIAQDIRDGIKNFITNYKDLHPKLTVFMVGNNPASNLYVKNNQRAFESVGMELETVQYPENIEPSMMESKILESTYHGHGIMLQMPFPDVFPRKELNRIIDHIGQFSDVDCITPGNLSRIWLNQSYYHLPSTVLGIMKIIQHQRYRMANESAVVIGRSTIVGKPMAAVLTNENMTVTLCHSHTDREDLMEALRRAKIIVCAVGRPGFLDLYKAPIRSDAIVFDVGINQDSDGHLCGDCYWSTECPDPYFRWTPVPGGVGVMTVTGLMLNTLTAAIRNQYGPMAPHDMLPPDLRVDYFRS